MVHYASELQSTAKRSSKHLDPFSFSLRTSAVNQPVPDELDYRVDTGESCEDQTLERAISAFNQNTVK
jgi:hypothetical protein